MYLLSLFIVFPCIAGTQVLGIRHEDPVLSCAAASTHDPHLLAVAEKTSGSSISVIDIRRPADSADSADSADAAAPTVAMLMVGVTSAYLAQCAQSSYSISLWCFTGIVLVSQTFHLSLVAQSWFYGLHVEHN